MNSDNVWEAHGKCMMFVSLYICKVAVRVKGQEEA